MKKYLLFCYRNYYPRGGVEDCCLRTNDLNEIAYFIRKNIIEEFGYWEYSNVHYYDLESGVTYELNFSLFQAESEIEWMVCEGNFYNDNF